jgi:hypothetical protein
MCRPQDSGQGGAEKIGGRKNEGYVLIKFMWIMFLSWLSPAATRIQNNGGLGKNLVDFRASPARTGFAPGARVD